MRRLNSGLTRGGARAAGPRIGRQGPRLCQEPERAHRPGGGCAPRAMRTATCQLSCIDLDGPVPLMHSRKHKSPGSCANGHLPVGLDSYARKPQSDSHARKPKTCSMCALHPTLPWLLRATPSCSTALKALPEHAHPHSWWSPAHLRSTEAQHLCPFVGVHTEEAACGPQRRPAQRLRRHSGRAPGQAQGRSDGGRTRPRARRRASALTAGPPRSGPTPRGAARRAAHRHGRLAGGQRGERRVRGGRAGPPAGRPRRRAARGL